MGYYVGTLALGYSTGNFFGGLLADHFGCRSTFQVAALLSFVPVALLWFLHGPGGQRSSRANEKPKAKLTLKDSFKALVGTGVGHRGYRGIVSQPTAPVFRRD
jgi:predicted MFS family arabinose efflux permease